MLKKEYAASKLKAEQAEHSKAENSKVWPTIGFAPAAFAFDVTIYYSMKRVSLIEIKKLIFLCVTAEIYLTLSR
ncbi:MAG: hypothetical protein KAR13_21220 [Desulfobulbaceae bacterium]|nr:hypothetical protein [Desulfobulbaceae bacterium]